MSVTCKTVQDLLPLYYDEICSEDSRELVKAHLEACEDCRAFLTGLEGEICLKNHNTEEDEIKIRTFQSIKKKLFRKNVIVAIVSCLCLIGIAFGVFSLLHLYTVPIEYEEGLLDVYLKEGDEDSVWLQFQGNYSRHDGYCITTEIDGKEKTIQLIYYADSLWTKYFASQEAGVFSLTHVAPTVYTDNDGVEYVYPVDEVYYLVREFRDPKNREKQAFESVDEMLQVIGEEAVLIWSRPAPENT